MTDGSAQPAFSPADEAAVRALLDTLRRAWNAGDGKAYGAVFTDGCDYVTFNGDRVRGCSAVATSHQQLFETHLKGSKLFLEEVDIKPASPDVAIVHCIGNSLVDGQKELSPSRRSIQTLVAVRTRDGWLFDAFQNTRIFRITAFRAILMKLGL